MKTLKGINHAKITDQNGKQMEILVSKYLLQWLSLDKIF